MKNSQENIRFTQSAFLGCLLLLLLMGSCSTKKNKWLNKKFHATTTRFNGYFNANEILKETQFHLKQAHENNYEEILPLFIYTNEDNAKSVYPDMDKIIEKCSKVIDRHSMEIGKKELNNWIDDSYLLIGKAHFYKRNFTEAKKIVEYVAKEYNKKLIKYDAILWMARIHIQEENYRKAQLLIDLLRDEKRFPEQKEAELSLVYVDLLMRQEKYDVAADQLESTIYLIEKKKERAKTAFILAQMRQRLGDSQQAIDWYSEVLNLKPSYEMAFQAKINQALAYNRRIGDSKKIEKLLKKMLHDSKNIEYFDQIYFALGDIEFEQGNDSLGTEYIKKSIETRIKNDKQKARSYIYLADYFFKERKYEDAQKYYKNAAGTIDPEHPKYNIIKNKSESLNELVGHLTTINEQDSLIKLSQLSEKQRLKVIRKSIKEQLEQEEAERIKKEEQLQKLQELEDKNSNSNNKGEWYFYNDKAMQFGINQFNQIWGDRVLEDNWRLKNKRSGIRIATADSTTNDSIAKDLSEEEKRIQKYLSLIPESQSEIDAAHAKIADAYYGAGLVYKEKLQDNDEAIDQFKTLVDKYDSIPLTLTTYYQLYRTYYKIENQSRRAGFGFSNDEGTSYYKNLILSKYPDSDYAKIIRDPDYFKNLDQAKQKDRITYESTYRKYKQRKYQDVVVFTNEVIGSELPNSYLPKYYFLKALAISKLGDKKSTRKILEQIVSKFPNTEEEREAKKILGMKGEDGNKKPVSYLYKLDDSGSHFYVLIFPKDAIKVFELKKRMTDFNKKFFANEGYRVSNSFVDKETLIIISRDMKGREAAMRYFDAINSDKNVFKGISDYAAFKSMVITSNNFSILYQQKKVDEYMNFFQQHYLE